MTDLVDVSPPALAPPHPPILPPERSSSFKAENTPQAYQSHQGVCRLPRPREQRPVRAFPEASKCSPEASSTGHERKEVAPTPVGKDVMLRPGCDVCKARPSRRRCIFERSRTIKSSSFCRSTAGPDRFSWHPSTTTASVQGNIGHLRTRLGVILW